MELIKKIAKRLTGYFLKGLLLIAPLGLTLFIVVKSINYISGLFPSDYTLLSVLLVIAATAFLGWVATYFIQIPVVQFFDRILERIPLIKFIYTSIRDLMSAFIGKEKRFSKPVLIQYSASENIYKIGFVTQNDVANIGLKEGYSAVYMPHSYNFSGELVLVKNDMLLSVESAPEEVMKFIVSGGVTRI
jgi:uncharacterized membrane protein